MSRCPSPAAVLAGALLLLCAGAQASPRPDVLLYPGDVYPPRTEHVFTYPLTDALKATRALLEAHDLDVEPFMGEAAVKQGASPQAGTQMITRWRLLTRAQQPGGVNGANYAGFNRMRRYYVQGQALGPGHSIVRIFRIDRDESYTGRDNTRDVVAQANTSSTSEGLLAQQWREFEQATETARRITTGPDDNGRDHAKVMADQRAEEEARRGEAALGGAQRRLEGDARFYGQYKLMGQDDMRGRNDHGVRDRELERELVQRLEQFPSLEFTGGGLDPAPPPGPAHAAPLTAAWELEQGGVPFTSPGVEGAAPLVCGEPVQGLEPLVKPGLAVLVGEQLGTREVPALVGHMACQLAQRKRPVLLALPLPREEQTGLDAYLRSLGTREDQEVLLTGEFWRQVPRDGRSSRALLVLIERVRRWRLDGLPIQAFAYDARRLKDNPREQQAAETILSRMRATPDATLLVLAGNEHVRLRSGASWNSALQPLGARLAGAGLPVQALDTAFARGERWACGVTPSREADCRVYATAPSPASYSPPNRAPAVQLLGKVSGEGYTGLLHVGPLTPSLPAFLPRTGAEPARPAAATAANVPEAVPAAAPPGPADALGSALAQGPSASGGSGAAPPLPADVVVDGEEAPLAASAAAGARPAASCGEAITGADPLFKPKGLVLLGEVQGSNEIPGVVGELVCQAASRGLPVTLALELPRHEQRRLNRFLASTDGARAQRLLLQGEFWHRTYQDGRSSGAMLQLLERMRTARHAGMPIEVLAFDTFAQGTEHEVLMAQALLAERARQPGRLMLVLTGNVHARTVKGTPWDPALLPLGHLLRQREPGLLALDVDHGGGAAYSCKLAPGGKVQCGVYRESAPIDMRREFMTGPSVERTFLGYRPFVQVGAARSAEGFDGLYYVGRLSPAAPAAPELRAAANVSGRP